MILWYRFGGYLGRHLEFLNFTHLTVIQTVHPSFFPRRPAYWYHRIIRNSSGNVLEK